MRSVAKLASDLYARARKDGYVDAHGLLLDLRNAADGPLTISCSGVIPENQIIYAMENSSRNIATMKLFICDHQNSWYYKGIPGLTSTFNETVALLRDLADLISPSLVSAIGTSCGGYMALAATAMAGFDRALALAPQTNIKSDWMESLSDYRWEQMMMEIYRHLGNEQPRDLRETITARSRPQSEFFVVYPTNYPLDVSHAMRLDGVAGVSLFGIDDKEHNVSASLKAQGLLIPIMEIMAGNTDPRTELETLLSG
jgi:hypothetical protein